jgi:hypothetical protein
VPDSPQTSSVRRTTDAMRRMLLAATFLVLLLGISLYVLADNTDRTAAWTITPPLTATFLGGAYFASLALELASSRERVWANARLGVGGVVVFAFIMLGVTLLHLDRFHLGADLDAAPRFFGWIWLVVYVLVPPVFAWVWRVQLREPGGEPDPVSAMPDGYRLAARTLGIGLMAVGLLLLIAPVLVGTAIWPWPLSPLTGRSTGAWLIGLGLVATQMAHEGDWTRVWGAAWGFLAFAVLQLAALARFPGIVSYSDWRMWLYLTGVLSLGLAGLFALPRSWRARAAGARSPVD